MLEILIVEDDPDVREILAFNIDNAGYATIAVSSAEEGLDRLSSKTSLILLDVMLPGMSGYQFAQKIRNELRNNTPIIFLTAKSEEKDLLAGFNAGGDDYISKPFSINVLLARLKAVLKRYDATAPTQDKVYQYNDLVVDVIQKTVLLHGKSIELSRKEFDILTLLCANPGTYFSRTTIIAELWKDAPYVLDRTVDVHIARIRAKLGDCRDFIKNRIGFGYYIEKA